MKSMMLSLLLCIGLIGVAHVEYPRPRHFTDGAVQVVHPIGHGSGVVIRTWEGGCYVLTCGHVVQGREENLEVSMCYGSHCSKVKATVVLQDFVVRDGVMVSDFAILKCENMDFIPSCAKVDARDCYLGEKLHTLGVPKGFKWYSHGSVASLRSNGFHYYNGTIWFGASGGMVMDSDFEVIGIMQGLHNYDNSFGIKTPMPNMGVFVSLESIFDRLSDDEIVEFFGEGVDNRSP